MNSVSTAEIARTNVFTMAVVASCALATSLLADGHTRFERTAKESPSLKRHARSTAANDEHALGIVIVADLDAANGIVLNQPRETTDRERAIGELRRWRDFSADWDAEGALPPVQSSLKAASNFVCALDADRLAPEPMLHPSGLAGLFWKADSLYADLEFLRDGRVAYYIEIASDKHKGVVAFDGTTIPAVLDVALRA
jgi:hypothetical protein